MTRDASQDVVETPTPGPQSTSRATTRFAHERGSTTRVARERGSGTVLLLAVVGALVLVAGVIGLLAAAQGARGRAQAAADLAALAAAGSWQEGWADPCAVAEQAVRRNGARLGSCDALGDGVVVVVARVDSPAGAATARARAGPVPARESAP
ncbi:Rv3654c family TadE-like protein [Cellulomonas edaphi]|uniref:Flp pilus-assembly TadE/G-like family protein n=1 Tax=Cellulomonas edaphi TaxID=3053468 RepID=A0ABT7S9Q8_9CELL|nr:Rv3654c family TadE-like protein [Cellulomons edaphi]MDM7832284.1 flp pilus-assembly TadE/G-like family protein [Cellulomons edaphi]